MRALFCFLRRRRLASLWVDDARKAFDDLFKF